LNIDDVRGCEPFAGGQCWLVKIDHQTLQTLMRFLQETRPRENLRSECGQRPDGTITTCEEAMLWWLIVKVSRTDYEPSNPRFAIAE
jgi:hypothetical protein